MERRATGKVLNVGAGLVELTRALVDIESVSGNESQLVEAIAAALSKASWLDLTRSGNTVIATTDFGRPNRVVLAGHTDTVPISNNFPSKLIHLEREQVVWGRGSVDMKSGLAVMLKLATELSDAKFDLTWIFYDNEEVDSDKNGLGRVVREKPELLRGDLAVVLEPTAGFIEGGCNGTLRALVRVRGKKAHSARAWMGSNAIHSAAAILNLLAEYSPRTVTVGGLQYRESLNAVRIEAGIANNVIPDLATVTVNYRFAPDKSEQQAAAEVMNLLRDFEVEIVDSAPAAPPGLDLPLAQGLLDYVQYPPRAKFGWTDVARFAQLGMPALNFGPGDPNLAHTDDENVPVGQLHAVYEALKAWLSTP